MQYFPMTNAEKRERFERSERNAHKQRARVRWDKLRNKCYNPKCEQYHLYGEKGVVMHARWKNSFQIFYEDTGDPPEKNGQLRLDDGAEEFGPYTCHWRLKPLKRGGPSRIVQLPCQKSGMTVTTRGGDKVTVKITSNGRAISVSQAAKMLQSNHAMLAARIATYLLVFPNEREVTLEDLRDTRVAPSFLKGYTPA